MSTQTVLEGLIEAANLDPLGTGRSFLPRRKHDRPPARYGRRGIYVLMSPIPNLTGKRVFPGNKTFAFQAPPMDSFGETGTFAHNDYSTVSAGQHSQPVGRQLRSIQFKTIFLSWEPEWALAHSVDHLYPAQRAVKDLCKIRDSGDPFHLRAHQSNFQDDYEVDYAATLRSVQWEIDAGEVDCYYVTVQFMEFASPDIQEFLSGSTSSHKLPVSLAITSLGSSRNTLAKLAKYYYGDPSAWKAIAAANGLRNVAPNVVLSAKIVGRSKITIPKRKATKKHSGQKRGK